jgi:hypothetical protein
VSNILPAFVRIFVEACCAIINDDACTRSRWKSKCGAGWIDIRIDDGWKSHPQGFSLIEGPRIGTTSPPAIGIYRSVGRIANQ